MFTTWKIVEFRSKKSPNRKYLILFVGSYRFEKLIDFKKKECDKLKIRVSVRKPQEIIATYVTAYSKNNLPEVKLNLFKLENRVTQK